MSDPNLDLLPPALRMAAASGTASKIRRPARGVTVPSKTKSFQLRKDQADGLARIRCQPRQDIMTEDERRKQTLIRRQSMKTQREEELQQAKLEEKSKAIMSQTVVDSTVAVADKRMSTIRMARLSTIGGSSAPPPPAAEPSSKSPVPAAARMSWQRSEMSPHTAAKRTSSLKLQAQAMRDKVQALTLDDDDADAAKPKHSLDILTKKLEKVEKLLGKETPGTKDYKKLNKKKEQYVQELEEFHSQEKEIQEKADAIAKAQAELEEAEQMAQQAEEDEKQRRARAEAEEEDRKAREEAEEAEAAAAEEQESAIAEEARLLKERAEALKTKKAAEAHPATVEEREDGEEEEEEEEEPQEEVIDEKERIRRQRIEEFRRKQAEKKAEEEEAQRKAERNKEFKILKKKLQKLDGMIDDAEKAGKDTGKLTKKKNEYILQLEEFDEWQEELEARRKAEERERERQEREEAERQRKAALEQERRQKAEEEAERRRKEAEDAQRELEQLEKEREEKEERLRLQRIEDELREKEQAEARRIQDEEEAETRRIEDEANAARDAEQAEQRAVKEAERRIQDEEEAETRRIEDEANAARDAEQTEQRAVKEAEEAEARAAREAEEAKDRAAQEAKEAEERSAREAKKAEERATQEAKEAAERAKLQEAPPSKPAGGPPGGLLAAIQAKGGDDDSAPPRTKPPGGLMAAIAAKGGGDDDSAPPPTKPSGGLLEAIAARGGGDAAPPKRSGGLLAAISNRGGKTKPVEPIRAPPPAPAPAPVAEETPEMAERRKAEEAAQAKRREELREQTRDAEAKAALEASHHSAGAATTEPSQDFLDLRSIPEPHSENTKKILKEIESVESHQSRLEKTLKQNGIAVSEDIPYEVAKDKIAQLQEDMKALSLSGEDQKVVQQKYYKVEEELSKYITALMLTDEFAEEQRMAEENWEQSIEVDNIAALRKVRSHMPVSIRNMSEEELTTKPTPNGKMLPKAFAKKFKRSNVLQLLRVDPHDLERMHPSLIGSLRSTGLTLTERRALHEHLKDVGAMFQEMQQDPSMEKKFTWFSGLKSKFKEMVTVYDKHVHEYGPPGSHPYAKRNDPGGGGCPMIGNQCPVKADAATSYDDDYGYTQEAEYEASSSSAGGAKKAFATKAKARASLGGAKAKDEALMASIRERLDLPDEESAVDTKLIRELFFTEKRSASLGKQLAQNGITIAKEEIPFAVAKAKVAEITEDIKVIASKMGSTTDMKEMARLEKEYSTMSDDLEKYNNALMLTKEWALELLEKERQWEEGVRPDNQEALRKLRRHMPVNIKDLSEQDMIEGLTPNGKQLPQKIVRKFKRTNILQLVRIPPSSIDPMHPSSLEGMRSTGLTMTERRALHEHLKDLGAKWKAASNDKMSERKWMWQESLRSKYKELVDKYQQHVDQYGPPGNHPYAKARGEPGCPLIGKQCPLKADLDVDYSEDYGFPAEDIYNVEKVKKSNLLTVEELERRKQDDEWGGSTHHSTRQQEEEEPSRPTAGLMTKGGGGGAIKAAATASAGSDSRPKMGGGLMAALAAKGGGGGDAPTAKPPGGLLAAIATKGGGDSAPPPAKPPGGLLAAIAAKGGDSASAPSPAPAAAPAPAPAAVAPEANSPTKKKRMGGLLSAITGRGKK
jgi:hypothetical protein